MSYTHKLVSEALTNTNNEPPIDHPAIQFAGEVALALRIKVHPKSQNSFWLYRDDCPYVLGWVGYGDFRQGGDGTEMYVVHSRKIDNGKYADYNDQHYMKMSINLDAAVRNAKRYLRIYSPQELANINANEVARGLSEVKSDANDKLREAQSKVIDVREYGTDRGSRLLVELRHLLTTNYEFRDPQFSYDLQAYFDAKDEHTRLSHRSVPMWFVRVYERFGRQAFDVVSIDKAENYSPDFGETAHFNDETLPTEIMEKLSVLNILSDKQFVDDVGYRAGEGMFYVVR